MSSGLHPAMTALMATFSAVTETWRFSMNAICFSERSPPACKHRGDAFGRGWYDRQTVAPAIRVAELDRAAEIVTVCRRDFNSIAIALSLRASSPQAAVAASRHREAYFIARPLLVFWHFVLFLGRFPAFAVARRGLNLAPRLPAGAQAGPFVLLRSEAAVGRLRDRPVFRRSQSIAMTLRSVSSHSTG